MAKAAILAADMDDEKNAAGPTSRLPSLPSSVGGQADPAQGPSGGPAKGKGDSLPPTVRDQADTSASLLPESVAGGKISRRRARQILHGGRRAEKAKLLSLLLSYAEWDEIWALTDQAAVQKLFPHLDLPAGLRRAWARYLGMPPVD